MFVIPDNHHRNRDAVVIFEGVTQLALKCLLFPIFPLDTQCVLPIS
jgi:hypothetical protein